MMRERHEEERAELAAFCEMIAEFFGCKDLATDHWHIRFKPMFQEARRYAHARKTEAERASANAKAGRHKSL